jgi:hypothetical protein
MELDDEPRTSTVQVIWTGVVWGLALILVVLGMWALGGAIYYAWGLFRNPDSIAYFADYLLETTKIASYLPSAGDGVAHYLAWITVILLLLVLGKLGAWAVAAAAQLLSSKGR